MNDWVIDIKNLTKKFNDKIVVNNLSLKVKRGTIFGFLGSNGSGKTTTIRMICGLLTPTSGEGHCLGYDIRSQSNEIKKNIGYMTQKFSFYVGLTVYENLRFIVDVYQVSDKAQAIEEIMSDLSLKPYRDVKAGSLSGGWKQVLALACCLVYKPKLLFLDEPTAGMDPGARKDFWDYLNTISIKNETTVLITTHYMDEAEKCIELAYIHMGELLYSGSTKNLISYSEVKTWMLVGDRNEQNLLIQEINQSVPELLVSIVNNDLRISSRNLEKLNQFIREHSNLSFNAVSPSFEEVFIGLIR